MKLPKANIHVYTNFSDGLHDPETVINYAVTQTDLNVMAITVHKPVQVEMPLRIERLDPVSKIFAAQPPAINTLRGNQYG
ncbi:MAG: hypothetical protein KDJ97_00305 [Anaerolineae bacterium]|nr:hypothetical protein [Anaerolineae bacterium]